MKPDPQGNELPATKGEKIFTIVFAAVMLVMLGVELAGNYEPKKLGAVLFLVFWMPLVAVHEFAHAIVARAIGWHVGVIVIGFGKVVSRFDFRSIPVEIRMIPIEGFILTMPGDMNKPRLKDAAIHFAGPGVELLIFLLILLFMNDLFVIKDDYPRIAVQSLAFCALAGGVMNLIPHSTFSNRGEIPNDGLAIIRCALTTDSAYTERFGSGR